MRLKIAIGTSIGAVIAMVIWAFMVMTRTCFDGFGFSVGAIFTIISYLICGLVAMAMWIWIIVDKICSAIRDGKKR